MQRTLRSLVLLPSTLALGFGMFAWAGLADASPEAPATAPISSPASSSPELAPADEQVCSELEAEPIAAGDG